jgi:hypothetical protein
MDSLFDQSIFVQSAITGGSQARVKRLPHRADDPAVPRLVAAHLIVAVHPAVDPRLHLRPERPGPDVNVMTLGLALAAISWWTTSPWRENNHRHPAWARRFGGPSSTGPGSYTPAIVATLSICIVFVPTLPPDRSRVPVRAAAMAWCSRCWRATPVRTLAPTMFRT